ncbi:MAG TPA: succinate--CoA ligase subunit alpha [Limnochordales bacterium]
MLNPPSMLDVLRIDRHTPVIVQGITGRTGRLHANLMRRYGTRVVGGVAARPGVTEVDGFPVFDSCEAAVAATGAWASLVMVPPDRAAGAVLEAVAAGIRLIVSVTEGIPVHDVLRVRRAVKEAGAVWIGPSSPGIAVPGEAKIGFLPDVSLLPGPLGVMSKSGTLSYEVCFRLARRGIGQSVWVGVGGDMVKGTRFADLVPFFAADEATRAVLVIGEIGGNEEEELAAALRRHGFRKPVFALIAGQHAPEGVTMGHAGALVHGRHGTAAAKRAALEEAGVHVFGTIQDAVEAITQRLSPAATGRGAGGDSP